ncbi:MerR family transcriptional regulator [Mycobacterium aquaticum]|uniref:MerR family transcriptional regulator n=1 Tax=Mycobacterium aquaticum TaxID=1927124 RepID=A0A1X0A894_9MYCO|nr:MerR family transcriptional regulator [Mycobacterium aquaticum]ORA26281.1 MerR family transcriptional regulator [Mycobacterium aquaticum]
MGSEVPIGDFSVMTRLSKKALRHYHDLGLLVPAHIDTHSGYRFYDTAQVDHAHIIRRFRSLQMSIPDIKALLSAPDIGARNALIAAHLAQMQEQLERTQDAVRELIELLSPSERHPEVHTRQEPRTLAWAITSTIDIASIGSWFATTAHQLTDALRRSGAQPHGPASGLYARELFSESRGEATLYIGTTEPVPPPAPVRAVVLPAAEFAVLTHVGSTHTGIDRSYGHLGSYVSNNLMSGQGPIREHYLGADCGRFSGFDRTEICWPIFGTAETGTDMAAAHDGIG